MKFKKYTVIILILFVVYSCATFKPKYNKDIKHELPNKEIAHSFYLIGSAGNSPLGGASNALKAFKDTISEASKNSTAIFLGDNAYPKGLPKKNGLGRNLAEYRLNVQIDAVKNFKGKTIFIPGNHDWHSDGLKGLKRQEDFIESRLGENSFLPKNGCPIEKVPISDKIVVIVVDTEWYLTNWDKHPSINDKCEIKTREQFFYKLEDEIKKAIGKTTIIALHHPMFTNGPYGGQYPFISNFKPFPFLGTLKNVIRKTGGIATEDFQNKLYRDLRKRIVTISQENDKTIFVSAHDNSLQYLTQENLPQIVSGSGSKQTRTRNIGGGQFAAGMQGFVRLDVFKDGSTYARFYSTDDVIFQTQVFTEDSKVPKDLPNSFPKTKEASIYTKDETKRYSLYKLIWGDRYREDYSTEITASTVDLDTLFGGLKPITKGGGHLSRSLRLKDSLGREYTMHALRKNALQYLQAKVFKDQYIEGQFDNTETEKLLQDMFTGSHPYAPFAVGELAEAVGVYHTNPVLYYVPKQKALGSFNDDFGDELYMIEESATSGHGNKASFGFSNTLISTDEVLEKIVIDEAHELDESAYIRARLFDMLIGDWDRHKGQWLWATFEENGKTIYRPFPRSREQAFSAMSDGLLLSVATQLVPPLQLMKSYDDDIKNPERFNAQSYLLDIALINHTPKAVWDSEIKHIVNNLSDKIIDKAFSSLPKEINQNTILDIKKKLKERLKNLNKIADDYYNYIKKYAIIRGTNEEDWFEIERKTNGETHIAVYRKKNGEKADLMINHIYNSKDTNEIWVYGLDKADRFEVFSEGNKLINLRLIGGHDTDVYDISNGKKLKIYDYKSEENIFITNNGDINLTDDYETNSYDYKKIKKRSNAISPLIGADPDNGLQTGIVYKITNSSVERNPFTSQHRFSGSYYYATDGFDINYYAEQANVVGNANLSFSSKFTSPNYTVNFFGYGNNTPNPKVNSDGLDVTLDFNRVKLESIALSPSLIWRGQQGSSFESGLSYESFKLNKISGRFVNDLSAEESGSSNNFLGLYGKYKFENIDNKAFPTLGMLVSLEGGYKASLSNVNGFGYLIPEFGFVYKLTTSNHLVLDSKIKGHFNFGYNFEFYQAANLGANSGLRAYRNNRFAGRNSIVHITDLRVNLTKVKTLFLPLNVGFYLGADYGRVWVKESLLLDPSHDSTRWNTSIGGGVFASAIDMLSLTLSVFHGDDGYRVSFGLGLGF